MASSFVPAGYAPLKPYDDSYAILLMTPKSDNGTFEYDLGQIITPERMLSGRPCVFFRKQNPTNCDWTHMVIYNLRHYVLHPSMPELKQRWQFNLNLPNAFQVRYSRSGGGIVNDDMRDQGVVTEPPDLAEKLQEMHYRSDLFLYVLTFVEFASAESEARYRESVAKVEFRGFQENEWTLHVHLACPVTQSALTRLDLEQPDMSEVTDFLTLTSFASARKYAEWLMSEEHKTMVGEGDGEVKESMVLTQPINLPPAKGWENYRYDVFGK